MFLMNFYELFYDYMYKIETDYAPCTRNIHMSHQDGETKITWKDSMLKGNCIFNSLLGDNIEALDELAEYHNYRVKI